MLKSDTRKLLRYFPLFFFLAYPCVCAVICLCSFMCLYSLGGRGGEMLWKPGAWSSLGGCSLGMLHLVSWDRIWGLELTEQARLAGQWAIRSVCLQFFTNETASTCHHKQFLTTVPGSKIRSLWLWDTHFTSWATCPVLPFVYTGTFGTPISDCPYMFLVYNIKLGFGLRINVLFPSCLLIALFPLSTGQTCLALVLMLFLSYHCFVSLLQTCKDFIYIKSQYIIYCICHI